MSNSKKIEKLFNGKFKQVLDRHKYRASVCKGDRVFPGWYILLHSLWFDRIPRMNIGDTVKEAEAFIENTSEEELNNQIVRGMW